MEWEVLLPLWKAPSLTCFSYTFQSLQLVFFLEGSLNMRFSCLCLPSAGIRGMYRPASQVHVLYTNEVDSESGFYMSRSSIGWVWWCTLIIAALRKLRQEDQELKSNLGYVVRSCFKKEVAWMLMLLTGSFGAWIKYLYTYICIYKYKNMYSVYIIHTHTTWTQVVCFGWY
jgi:hypothetical protein